MIIIKFFSDWTSDEHLLETIKNKYNWDLDKNYNTKYKFTIEDNFTHAILYNQAMPKLNINKKNVIGITNEPNQILKRKGNKKFNIFINYNKEFTSKYIITNLEDLKYPFVQDKSYLIPGIDFKIVSNMIEKYPEKNKIMNFVFSKKTKVKNCNNMLYNYRYRIARSLLKENINVDIYGTSTLNLNRNFKSENIKYPFENNNINNIYKDYKFSIVIENSIEPEYFTEKIMNALLCGCIPVYLGCENIDKYFKNYVIKLSGNLNNDINKIKEIIKNPKKYYKKVPIEEIREIIHLKNLINKEFIK